MPLLRYFVSVGGLLLALLVVAGWFWPGDPMGSAQKAATESSAEQTIRIQSERRWPDRIVFDTNQPTIVPPPAPAAAASAPPAPPIVAASSPLDARAEVKSVAPPAPPKRKAKVRHQNPRPDYWQPPSAVAAANPISSQWSFRW